MAKEHKAPKATKATKATKRTVENKTPAANGLDSFFLNTPLSMQPLMGDPTGQLFRRKPMSLADYGIIDSKETKELPPKNIFERVSEFLRGKDFGTQPDSIFQYLNNDEEKRFFTLNSLEKLIKCFNNVAAANGFMSHISAAIQTLSTSTVRFQSQPAEQKILMDSVFFSLEKIFCTSIREAVLADNKALVSLKLYSTRLIVRGGNTNCSSPMPDMGRSMDYAGEIILRVEPETGVVASVVENFYVQVETFSPTKAMPISNTISELTTLIASFCEFRLAIYGQIGESLYQYVTSFVPDATYIRAEPGVPNVSVLESLDKTKFSVFFGISINDFKQKQQIKDVVCKSYKIESIYKASQDIVAHLMGSKNK